MAVSPLKRVENQTIADDDKPQRKRIQSVERALGILEVLAASNGEIRLNAIAKALDLNVSTCHHLLSTLVDNGYAAQSTHGQTYYLGGKILELYGSRMRQFNLTDLVMSDLRNLNEETGEAVHLSVLQGDRLVTLAVLDSRFPVRVVTGGVGESAPIHATATGKAILAWLPEVEMDRILSVKGLTQFTENTVTEHARLVDQLRLIRRKGIAYDQEEFQHSVFCVGAAIRDHFGAVIGAFSCSMPALRAQDEHLKNVEESVKKTARALMKILGNAN
jgi:IclR family acetate operon transcriptional repressor